jgi:dolichol-phosphate mannosyltransferase
MDKITENYLTNRPLVMLTASSSVASVTDEREGDTVSTLAHPASELTVVVPTLNERDNIAPFLKQLEAVLAGVAWEVIFVDDDSLDGTADAVRAIARRNGRVRCLQRIGRRGLSTACIEGVLASASPYIAVMDADLQHDERLLPKMLETLKNETCELAVGSRYVEGGGVGKWSARRANLSGFATRLSRVICKADIADPMSGFFMVRREVFERAVRNLSGRGFKILLDLLASSPKPVRLRELPFEFRERQHGASKFDTLIAWQFGLMLVDKLVLQIASARFALLTVISVLGLVVHLSVLWTSLDVLGLSFIVSQGIATAVATTSNFLLDNLLRYHDQHIKGARFLGGLPASYLICGAGANIAIASYLFTTGTVWWLAGVSGATVGSAVQLYCLLGGRKTTPIEVA